MRALLSPEEYEAFASRYGLDREPNFEDRHWHLVLAREPAGNESDPHIASARAKVFAAREKRIRPGRDEKILVSWNALAIRGMARAGRVFDNEAWIDSARRALDFIRAAMWRDGRLRATYKDGRAHLNAYLDDYAFLLAAQLELLQPEFSVEALEFATRLADVLVEQFEDRDAGGFFFTARDHERLIHRPKPGQDHATPSGNAVAAWTLNRLSALTGEPRYAEAARRTLELFYPAMREFPGGFAMMAIALDEALAQPKTLVLRGAGAALASWQAALARVTMSDTLALAIPDGMQGLPAPLDKPRRPGAVNAWLCRGVTCLEPIADLQHLEEALKENV